MPSRIRCLARSRVTSGTASRRNPYSQFASSPVGPLGSVGACAAPLKLTSVAMLSVQTDQPSLDRPIAIDTAAWLGSTTGRPT